MSAVVVLRRGGGCGILAANRRNELVGNGRERGRKVIVVLIWRIGAGWLPNRRLQAEAGALVVGALRRGSDVVAGSQEGDGHSGVVNLGINGVLGGDFCF